jgi:hypothetical protein
MYAQVRRQNCEIKLFLYDPEDTENTLYDADRPAFLVTFDKEQRDWLLSYYSKDWYSPRQDSEGEKQDVAAVYHSRLEVGDGLNHCLEADVLVEAAADEYTMTGGPRLCEHGTSTDDAMPNIQRLLTKQATWNEELKTLVLDFRGRKVIPSAKNFQLAAEGQPSRVVCQHGKIGNNRFSLDIRYPLSISQAFALSLSTIFWE